MKHLLPPADQPTFLFPFLASTIRPFRTGNGGSLFLEWRNFCFSRHFCFTLLNLISWERFTENFWRPADNSREGSTHDYQLHQRVRDWTTLTFSWNIFKSFITDKQIFAHYFSNFVKQSLIPRTCLKQSLSNLIVYCRGDLSATFSHT